jgi:hypothetical protein
VRWPWLVAIAAVLGCGAATPAEQPTQIDTQPKREPQPTRKPTRDEVATLADVRAFLDLPTLAYARAFAINIHTEYSDHEDLLVDDLGQLNPDRAPVDGVLLNEAQLAELMRIATGGDGDRMGPAFCFHPHHAVALYDADGAVLGELTFCFMCGRMQSTFEGLGPDAVFKSLAVMLEELGVPLDLPVEGLPPTLGRPAVKRAVETYLTRCNNEPSLLLTSPHPGRPALSFAVHVGSDGAVSQVVGLDERTKLVACLRESLLDERFPAAQAASVHHFEFKAIAKTEPRADQPRRTTSLK